MPPEPGSLGRVGSRKRRVRDMMGSQSTMIIDLLSNDPPSDDNEVPSPTYRLLHPIVSSSGEESTSSHSNESAETDSDTVSESQATFSFESGCPKINWRRRRQKETDTISWSWILPQKQNTQEIDPTLALPKLPESDTIWDDSSWSSFALKSRLKITKQKTTKEETSATKLKSSIRASNLVECNRSKRRKVRGILFATAEPFQGSRKLCTTPLENNLANTSDHDHKKQKQKSLLRIPLVPRFRNQRNGLSSQSSSMNSPSVLHRWLRVKLEAGLVLPAFEYLHRVLKRYYGDVVQVVENLKKGDAHPVEIASIQSLKDRIAGIWCVYAHFILEAGCLMLEMTKQRESHLRKSMCNVESEPSFDDFSNLALSVLWHARDCPLVGNHAAIGICFGRLIVSSTVAKNSTPNSFQVEFSRRAMIENIQSAIDACWDSIDLCRLRGKKTRRYAVKPISKRTIESFSKFELYCDETNHSEVHGREVVEVGILSTLLLPMNLRNSFPSGLFLSKKTGLDNRYDIDSLCKELNRLSRLGEKLELKAQNTVRLRACDDSNLSFVVDELPLYSSIEYLSDPFDDYKGISNPGKEIIWSW